MRHIVLALALLASPAAAQDFPDGPYDVPGVDDRDRADRYRDAAIETVGERQPSYYGNRYMRVGGQGASNLDPWLAATDEGRQWVLQRYDRRGDGRVNGRTARRANNDFRVWADSDRDLRLTDEEIRTALATIDVRGTAF